MNKTTFLCCWSKKIIDQLDGLGWTREIFVGQSAWILAVPNDST